jgi:hypothetical protein
MPRESELKKFVPKTGAAGQVDVNFSSHEKRAGSSPAEMRDGPKNQAVVIPSTSPARPKRNNDH